MNTRRFLVFLCLLASGCAGLRPSTVSTRQPYLVVVKSVRIPSTEPWISRFACHTWFDLKNGPNADWERIEILAVDSGVMDYKIPPQEAYSDFRWTNRVSVIGMIQGDLAKSVIPKMETLAKNYPDKANYWSWPGPNSNTFTASIVRQTPELRLVFDHNAVGKDFVPWFYAGPSVTGSGWQADTWLLGVQFGLRDGIQIHFIQLTLGVSLFPPALDLPILPRIGWPAN